MNRYLQRAADALQASAGTLTVEQLSARPAGKWSVAEIIEHLARAFSGTAAGVRRALAEGRPLARRPDLPNRLRALVVCDFGYMPTGRRSPKVAVPVGIEPATALAVATKNLREMDAALGDAAARFGTRVKLIDHPILGPMSVRQWRKFHWVHTRHHVRQILRRVN